MAEGRRVEAAAEAAHDAMPWCYGQDLDGEDVYKPWSEAPEAVKDHYRREIEAALAAADRVDPVRREAREVADRLKEFADDISAMDISPAEAGQFADRLLAALDVPSGIGEGE